MKPLSTTSSNFMLSALPACALGVTLISPGLASAASGGRIYLEGERMSSNAFQFSFSANAGQAYRIEASVDLVHWGWLTNVVGAGGRLWITDREAARFRQRFYQIDVPVRPITNMVFIQPGTFMMGSPPSEAGRGSDEGPQMEVTISRGFWIGKYEVTQTEYVSVIGWNDSHFQLNQRLPADLVAWDVATNYCNKLTERERAAGRLPASCAYRLPTEAEWEYACRAGKATPFSVGDGTTLSSIQANFDGTFPYGGGDTGPYLKMTTLGGAYAPNAWGLCDMHGNVWEWCQDWYAPYPGGKVTDPRGPSTGTARVLRGGGWTSLGQGCRSAKRDSHSPDYKYFTTGFRVVLSLAP